MPRDFNHQSLCGRSFNGQDLAGANFSCANIQGADFTNANLANANFSNVKAGKQLHWTISTVCGLLLIAVLAGFISAFAGAFVGSLMAVGGNPEFFWSSIIAVIVLIIFIAVTIRQGLGIALGALAVTLAAGVAVFAALIQQPDFIAVAIIQSLGIASAIAGAIVGAIALATAWTIARQLVPLTIIFTIVGAIPGALEGVGALSNSPDSLPKNAIPVALLITGIIVVILMGLSLYISWRVVAGDTRFVLIPTLVATLSSLGGTRFRGANLTDANFTQARLKSVDLRTATLTRTCWFQAHKLGQARIKGTYLENPSVRQLVVTKQGQNSSFDHLDLRSLDLKDANLQDSSFIRADLSDTNLQNANLAGAKLVKAHLYQADLTAACLTGAYIQDWGISTDTTLEAVQCDYIYMHLPTKEDPDPCRKPDNRREVFKEGDFSDFIAPIIKTLDLYRSQNVDPRRMASTFKTLDLFHYEGIDPSAAALTLQKMVLLELPWSVSRYSVHRLAVKSRC
ncbi:MAG: pentapeptide repeat-containing protein [Cyanobacteria bacterium]|nr:pentapeptide repeat-containing protein [Cyanobacteriota bacterium]